MNAELKKLKKEYISILVGYLGKHESNELINQVFSGYSLMSNSTNQANSAFNDSFKIRSVIDRIITYTEKSLTSKKHLSLLLNLAKLSLSRGELFLSSDIYSQALYKTTNLDNLLSETAFAFKGLGEVSSLQAKWNESFSYVRKAKKIFEKLSDIKGIASCENLLGTFYAERGILSSAKEHFEAGLTRIKGKKSGNLDALILVNLGILNNIIGNTKEAEENYRRALSKFEKVEDNRRIAETHHNLGMLFTKLGDYKSALSQFNISVKVSSKDKNLLTLAISYLGKAYIYTEMNKLELAADFVEKGMEISNKLNDRLTIADVYKVRGIIERKSNNYELSESYLLTSLRINSELGNKLNHSETSYELGLLYIELNQSQKAIKHLNSALKYFKKIKAVSEVEKIESLLK
ncbi:MAG: tetratricopeptide repeat protein [Melioribacteraceae bacterium]|nr:tetratricopeptide repeat protein [Melioribacteraceae bacterium]